MGVNFYPGNIKDNSKFYSSSSKKELDLRDELHQWFYGSSDNYPHSFKVLYRRLGTTRCTCWQDHRMESDPRCPYCKGESYLWTEEEMNTYQVIAAPIYGKSLITQDVNVRDMHIPSCTFYLEHYRNPKLGDCIIEVKLDEDGKIYVPVQKTRKYRIALMEDLRSDYGRVEFYACHCKMEPL